MDAKQVNEETQKQRLKFYAHEHLDELMALKKIVKYKKNVIVHDDGKGKQVFVVSTTQKRAWNIINSCFEQNIKFGHENQLKVASINIKTIKALIKKGLVEEKNGIFIPKMIKETASEIMSKGGVGKIVINIPC